MSQRVILDGDYGIDDALALLYLAGTSTVEILAVGSVHGNAGADQAADNALRVLGLAGIPDVPVAVGARQPLAQPVRLSSLVHGEDGLGGAVLPPARGRRVVSVSAAEQMVQMARAYPGECSILATGPFTNLALALLMEPELPHLIERVVLMGGAVAEPGNVTPSAEANIFCDPEAAAAVLSAPWPVTMVALDATMGTWLEVSDLDRIESTTTPAGKFVQASLSHYLDFHRKNYGRHSCPLHDPSAAVVLTHPSTATCVNTPVKVELCGEHTRGMTVVDRRGNAGPRQPGTPEVQVVVALNREQVVNKVLDTVLGPPT
ncbi:nucleoside hydrolase [Streptomyces sp. NPDC088745]|uniref:nucleoside hydrolase n=1 Tax=Streptomyces sp. NPDC088745 TaxID=3365884 RepID=UPI00380B0260